MKNILSKLLAILAVGALVLGFTACSGQNKANVDVPAQIQALETGNAEEKQLAAIELAKAGPHAGPAVPALIEAMKHPDPLVRRLAAYALYEIGPPHGEPAIPAVRALLKDPDVFVAQQAVNTLQVLDPDAPVTQKPNVTR